MLRDTGRRWLGCRNANSFGREPDAACDAFMLKVSLTEQGNPFVIYGRM
jgi:hypothetical protein